MDKKGGGKIEFPESRLISEIRGLSARHGLNHVFSTFLEITALTLSMEADPTSRSERLSRYEEIMAAIDSEESTVYARMIALLYVAASTSMNEPRDILGSVYGELNLANEWCGQYFTPDHICRLMAMLVGLPEEKALKSNGSITVNEPTCGSGAMVLGYAYAMRQSQTDYENKVLFVLQDIDIRCVWMAYIQCFMYRIPAVVIHGNTLTMEEWSRWFTPFVTYVPHTGSVDMAAPKLEQAVV